MGETRSWVLVTGDFVRHGGMDRANFELARWLAGEGVRVELVAHRVDPELAALPLVTSHLVPRPFGAHALGGLLLDRAGVRVASAAAARGARVLVNGANCRFYDASWVHAVHAAWPVLDGGAPLHVRAKNRVDKWRNRRREAHVLGRSRVVIANSEKTRRELVSLAGVDERRVRVVYLGTDPELDRPAAPEAIAARRRALGVDPSELLVLFIGALGHDRNKGLDTLLDAWALLRRGGEGAPRGRILALGSAVPRWQREIGARGLEGEVRLLGFRADAGELLAAADLLVAPSRYDSYGLSVQEALCRNVAAIASSRAGVSERYPDALRALVLQDPEDARALANAIASWARARDRYAPAVAELAETLRRHTWARMSEVIAEAVEGHECG